MKTKIPRWLELQAEIDFLHWELTSIFEQEKKRAPIELMIDEATGYDKKKLKEASKIIARIERLKEEFYKEKPQKVERDNQTEK